MTSASRVQRERVAGKACVVCRRSPCDPAHVVPRSMLAEGQDEALAVVPLCRHPCHRAYDTGDLDLLPYLELGFREELAFAVLRHGLLATLRAVTNERVPA